VPGTRMLVGKLAFVELILALVNTTGPVRAQTPQIQAGGVVNAASYSSGVRSEPGYVN